jgi:hypothetical protein
MDPATILFCCEMQAVRTDAAHLYSILGYHAARADAPSTGQRPRQGAALHWVQTLPSAFAIRVFCLLATWL